MEEEELTPEVIAERELCIKENRKEAEGTVKNFFKKLFGWQSEDPDDGGYRSYNSVDDPEAVSIPIIREDADGEAEDDEVDAEEEVVPADDWDGDPYVVDGMLYGQNYDKIRARCRRRGERFVDPFFPAESKSLFYTSPAPRFTWKRPSEICIEPKLFVDGADRFDINQGELGDCWVLAAMSSLAMDHNLFHQVVPPGQSFDPDDYDGVFKFRFWQYGEWVDVVVDDYLPTQGGKLVFIRSDSRNEFWGALMEKAYAKLQGSYEALKGGSTCEAMVDFTGGCGEVIDLAKPPSDLFNILLQNYKRKSMNGCSIEADPAVFEAKTPEGLIKGHAYTITKVVKANIETPRVTGLIPLVRVRNPWGNSQEWTGTWRDEAKEWDFIPLDEKVALGISFDNDGEWWMSFKDFVKHYDQLEICNLSPECLERCGHGDAPKWCVNSFHGAWINGESAGGCRNFLQTFALNPQYVVELCDTTEEDGDGKATLIVSLMQKNRRAQRDEGLSYLSIGFVLYRLKPGVEFNGKMDVDFFKYTLSCARSKSFINQREVTQRMRLDPGRYLIIPSTYDPGYEGEFLLRTFAEQ